ncbi:hypothetical protein ACFQX6_04535 [Streptosporangium lutulentum]
MSASGPATAGSALAATRPPPAGGRATAGGHATASSEDAARSPASSSEDDVTATHRTGAFGDPRPRRPSTTSCRHP